jgi:hypothetical protein
VIKPACAMLAIAAGAGTALAGEPLVPAPTGTTLVLEAEADGVQIYNCEAQAGRASWVLKSPEANLFDKPGRQIGRHYSGPTWRLEDGSSVVGEVSAKADAPAAGAIPWLLLAAKARDGSGLLASVAFVRRTDTRGGVAPGGGCDAQHAGLQARMRYSALYQFYAAAKQ